MLRLQKRNVGNCACSSNDTSRQSGTDAAIPFRAEALTWRAGANWHFRVRKPDSVLVIDDERVNVRLGPPPVAHPGDAWRGGSPWRKSRQCWALRTPGFSVTWNVSRTRKSYILKKPDSDPRAWRCVPAAGKIRFPDPIDQTTETTEPMPREVVCQFKQAFRESADGIFGPRFQSSVNHNRARLSEEQAAEFNRRLLEPDRGVLSARQGRSLRNQVWLLRGPDTDRSSPDRAVT